MIQVTINPTSCDPTSTAAAAAAAAEGQVHIERCAGAGIVVRLGDVRLLFDSVFSAAQWCADVAQFATTAGDAFDPPHHWRSTFAAALAARFREALERAESPTRETPEEAMAGFVLAVAENVVLPAVVSPADALRLARRRLPGWRGRPDLIARKALLFAAQHDPFPHIRVVRLDQGGFRIESKVEPKEEI